jgi:hypothetical protein
MAKTGDMSPLQFHVYHGTGCSGTSLPIDVENRAETLRQATSNELDV